MKMTKKKTLAVALVVGALVVGTATVASASPQGQEFIASLIHPGGGATDLNGNPVETKTYVGDTPPADLGKLEHEGSATPSK